MGTGTIQVWITGEGDPCGISQRPPDPDDPARCAIHGERNHSLLPRQRLLPD